MAQFFSFSLVVLSAILLILVPDTAAHPTSVIQPRSDVAKINQRATWLWNTTLITSAAGVNDILSFANSYQIYTFYLQINRDLDDSVYARFISAASSQNITVEALSGDPSWALDIGRPGLQAELDWIVRYQKAASSRQAFSGIHMDIEPYSLPDWSSNQTSVVSGWQKSVALFANTAKQLKIKSSADLPFWLNTIKTADGSQALDAWMLSKLDTANFMTYRNTATALLDVANAALKAGLAAKKPVRLAVETLKSAEGANISFYGKGAINLQAQMLQVTLLAKLFSSFAGIAIHDYEGWRVMAGSSS